jgi:putative nucleotidyltransferase with HDIG domain
MSPREVIYNLGDLPPLPQVATQVMQISGDSNASADDLHRIIQTDQALSAQLLKIANSAMFGMVREVTTLTQAILTLGFATARSVVLASSVKSLYTRGPAGPQERLLWEHALVTAITGSAFSKAIRYQWTEEVFLAGLMHDIGKSVMMLKFPESYGALLRQVHEEGGDGLSAELDTFGFDHAMVGEALLHSWNLANRVEAAVRWHHEPLAAPVEYRILVALVALGNQVAMDLQMGLGSPENLARATQEAQTILRLEEAAYQTHRNNALEALERDKALIQEF